MAATTFATSMYCNMRFLIYGYHVWYLLLASFQRSQLSRYVRGFGNGIFEITLYILSLRPLRVSQASVWYIMGMELVSSTSGKAHSCAKRFRSSLVDVAVQ